MYIEWKISIIDIHNIQEKNWITSKYNRIIERMSNFVLSFGKTTKINMPSPTLLAFIKCNIITVS